MPTRRVRASRPRLALEALELRETPATFSGAGPTLTIDLNNVNEAISLSMNGTQITVVSNFNAVDGGTGGNVSGYGTTTATVTSAPYTTINITDSAAGASVTLLASTANYSENLGIVLNNAGCGDIGIVGATTINGNFQAGTSEGTISSTVAGNLVVNGSLLLDGGAVTRDVLMLGSLTVTGTTAIFGLAVQADNAANDFTGNVAIQSGEVALLHDVNDLSFGMSIFALDPANQPTTIITAGGNITQTGAITSTANELDIRSSGGSITLTNASNNIDRLAISVTGANTASVASLTGLVLGNVTAGTGSLTLTTTNGTLSQALNTTIQIDGALTVNANSPASVSVALDRANRIEGVITIAETGGDLENVNVRNTSDTAAFPTIAALATSGDIATLSIRFDNNAMSVPAISPVNATLTAAGDITQSGAITTAGGSLFLTVLGDFGISLLNAGNTVGGNVGIVAADSTQPIAYNTSSFVSFTISQFGRGAVNITAGGNIIAASPLFQQKGAAPATFNSTAGTSVSLLADNVFTGSVAITGAALTTVSFHNTDQLARFDQLTVPATVTTLSYQSVNAAVLLPTISAPTMAVLNVTGNGIYQTPGSSLILGGVATFTGGNYPIALNQAGNDFTNLSVNNTGHNDVTVNDINALQFAGSTIGTGGLTVTAGGNISHFGATTIVQSAGSVFGPLAFTSTGGNINLVNNNTFRGRINASVAGANTLSVTNTPGLALLLGNIATAGGAFSATANQGMSQYPGSKLTLGAASSFAATGANTITLDNKGNSFVGPVALTAGNVSLSAIGAVVLATSNVTSALSITTGGAAAHSITQTGAITGTSTATFNSGGGNITLTNAGNDFAQILLNSTSTAVAVNDATGVQIGASQLGGGTLTITAGGGIATGASGAVVQTTGSGAITLTTPPASNVTLTNGGNLLRGAITVTNSNNVSLTSTGDVQFAPVSIITGNLTVIAGGSITLPSDLTQLNAMTLAGFSTTISSDVTVSTGNMDITGTVNFVGNRIVNMMGLDAILRNDVNVGGTLTFNMNASRIVLHGAGVWNQGANDLTVNGASAELRLGLGTREKFIMTGGNIHLPGNGLVNVMADGAFQVGSNPTTAETVTINNGLGDVSFFGNSTLNVGLGTTNDQLVVNGFGDLIVAGALLRTSGIAGSTPTPVLASQTAVLSGRFVGTVDAAGESLDVFTGSDIVTPTYSLTELLLQSGGTLSPSGTATGFLPNGTAYKVASSLGAAASLATLVDPAGLLYAVVRNNSAASSTLTFTATGGTGVLTVRGVMVHSTGATTIDASKVDFTGSLATSGTLKKLTARDLGVGGLLLLDSGGPVTGSTTLTARFFQQATAKFAGALSSFTVVAVPTTSASITADKFGVLKTTGNLALNSPGDFLGNLTSTSAGTGQVLSSASIAGTAMGIWDLGGTVGTIKTAKVVNWTLGTLPSATARNGGLLTKITKLDLGDVVTALTVNSTGVISTMQAFQIIGTNNVIRALALGKVNISGSSTLGLAGNLASTQFVLAGNAGGVKSEALAAMTVAGDIGSVGITALAGNIGSIKTSRSLFSTAVNAADIGGLGNVGSITASKVTTITLLARSLSKMSVVLNAAAGLLGEVTSAILRLTGNVGGVGLGTFSAAGPVASSSWFSLGGNVTKVTSARTIGSSSLIVSDPAFGKLGTLQAASFSGVVARARTIDAINASGAKEVAPASPLIVGNIVGGVIHAYDETGTVASIKTLSTAGSFDSSSVQAERGIGTLKVGRALNASTVVADDALVGNANVGRINSFNAGAITSSTLSAQTLGASKITGYATPDLTPGSKVFGDIVTSTINVAGATPTKPVGVASLSVQRSLNSALLKAPGGITTVTIGANVETSTINLDNPVNPAAGFLTTLTSSDFNNSTVRAGTGGNWSINAASAFQREGRVLGGKFVVLANATAASGTKVLGTLKIASDYFSSAIVDVPASVGTVTINGLISTASNINAGYATGARLENLNVGVWGSPNDTVGSRLSTQSVGTFAVKGNAARGFTGSVRLGFFDILGYNAGVGIGKFTASGNVTDSTFRVSDGDVTSFVVQRFEDSSLLVGFRPVKDNDLTATATAANWSATNRKIGLFQTTAPFNVTDVDNSSSFRNSNVFAAILGTITLSGVDPTEDDTTAFGIGFRASSAAGGTVKINGSATALTSPFVDNEFNYLGLSG